MNNKNFEVAIDRLKISRKAKGYRYICEMMKLPVSAFDKMMDAYDKVATICDTTPANVERQIRYSKRNAGVENMANKDLLVYLWYTMHPVTKRDR